MMVSILGGHESQHHHQPVVIVVIITVITAVGDIKDARLGSLESRRATVTECKTIIADPRHYCRNRSPDAATF